MHFVGIDAPSKEIMDFRCLDYAANGTNINILSSFTSMWANKISLYFFATTSTLTNYLTHHWYQILDSKHWVDMTNLPRLQKRQAEDTSPFIGRSYVPSSCQWNKILHQVYQKARNMSLIFINDYLMIYNGKDCHFLKSVFFKW